MKRPGNSRSLRGAQADFRNNPCVVAEEYTLDTAADQDTGSRFHGTPGYVNMAAIAGKYAK